MSKTSYIKLFFLLIIVSTVVSDYEKLKIKINDLDLHTLSPTVIANLGYNCVAKYSKLLNILPTKVQNIVIDQYTTYADTWWQDHTKCCNINTLLEKVNTLMVEELGIYYDLMTEESIINKDSLSKQQNMLNSN